MMDFDANPQQERRQDVDPQTLNSGFEQTANLFRQEYLDQNLDQNLDQSQPQFRTANLLSTTSAEFNPFEYRPMGPQQAAHHMRQHQPFTPGSWDYSREPQFRMQTASLHSQPYRFQQQDQMHRQFRPDSMPFGPNQFQEGPDDQNYPQDNSQYQDFIPQRRDTPENTARRTNQPEQSVRLRLNSGSGQRTTSDAVVFTPQGFDRNQNYDVLVFFHGHRSTAESSVREFQLLEQMRRGHPQTVLLVLEWQASPGASNGNAGRLNQQGVMTSMVREALQNSQMTARGFEGMDAMHIFSHSAGYTPTGIALNRNPELRNKVASVTMLDSLYSDTVSNWVQENLQEIASGNKFYRNIYGPSTAAQSRAQLMRLQSAMRHLGRPDAIQTANSANFRDIPAGIIFRNTNASHALVPNRYIAPSMEQIDV